MFYSLYHRYVYKKKSDINPSYVEVVLDTGKWSKPRLIDRKRLTMSEVECAKFDLIDFIKGEMEKEFHCYLIGGGGK